MKFLRRSVWRMVLTPHYGKSFFEKCKVLWREGIEKSFEATMLATLLPLLTIVGILVTYRAKFQDQRKKYHFNPMILRPGDPRIADIKYTSCLDN